MTPPKTFKTVVRLTAAGNVAYYDERKVGLIKQAFAVELSVPTEKVRVSITAASVKIEVEITAVLSKQANDAIKAQVESKLSSPVAASSFLSTANLTAEVVDEVTVVENIAPTQDGLPTAAVIGIAVGVVVVLGLLGAGAATIHKVPLESKVRNLKVVTRAAAFCYPSTTTTISTKFNTTPSHYGAGHASASPDKLRVRTESGALSEGSLSRRLKTSRTPDRVAPVLRPAAQAMQAAIWLQGKASKAKASKEKAEPAEAANAETPGEALEGSSIERHALVLHELFAQPSGRMSRPPSSGWMSRSSRVLPILPEESDAGSLRESRAARESRAHSPDRVAPVLRAGVRATQAVIRMQREVRLAEAEAAARAAEAQAAKAKAKAEAMAELVVVAEVVKAEAEARVAEAEAEANTTPARAPPPPLNPLRMCAVHTPLKTAH